jgi:hypothetical protein
MPLISCDFPENRCSERHAFLKVVDQILPLFSTFLFGFERTQQINKLLNNCNFIKNRRREIQPLCIGVNECMSVLLALFVRCWVKFVTENLHIILISISECHKNRSTEGRVYAFHINKAVLKSVYCVMV